MEEKNPLAVLKEKEAFVLIDGNAILHRAYHALPPLTTRTGELVNAVYGFATVLLRIIKEIKPKYLAVSFDTSRTVFRHQEYIGYKANRKEMDAELVSQIQRVYELVRAFNIPIYTAEGYEADDIIGTLATQAFQSKEQRAKGKVDKVLIVTGDKDFMQLVKDEEIMLYMPAHGLSEPQIIGEQEVVEKMGIKPNQVVDFKSLVGDSSDNYPGVPGIGPKTAVELLRKFGSLEGIYQHLPEIQSQTIVMKLQSGEASARLSQNLARILTNVPIKLNLSDCLARDFDSQKVTDFFEELGFKSLMKRIEGEEKNEKEKVKDERQPSLF